MRSPLTGIVFAIELTPALNMLLPLLVAVTIAHAFPVLTLRRSILTEKVSRRGYHLTRKYSIDPLEILFVREVVRTNVVALSATMTLEQTRAIVGDAPRPRRRQRLYPVVDADQRLLGVVTRSHLEHSMQTAPASMRIGDVSWAWSACRTCSTGAAARLMPNIGANTSSRSSSVEERARGGSARSQSSLTPIRLPAVDDAEVPHPGSPRAGLLDVGRPLFPAHRVANDAPVVRGPHFHEPALGLCERLRVGRVGRDASEHAAVF